ncbi:MAG: LacI family DNA-binding transcriptional regulator [Caldilineaceae bacterium]|nr:LacI family DNA-binding transcriptional regulator [Caldilineaceae bacterium]
MSTIRDVAAKANVHPSTVSRVFSGNARISERTRRRVLAAAKSLNFQPNAIARSLSVRRTHTIGLVVPHVYTGYFEDSFFPQIMSGLLDVTYAHHYRLLVSGCESYADEIVQTLQILRSRQADGIIVTSGRLDVNTVGELREQGTPLVLIGRPPDQHGDVGWVDADNQEDTRRIIARLIELGHRRIAYVGGDPDTRVVKERLEGYQQAMTAAGIAVNPAWVDYGYFAEDGGYQAVGRTQTGDNSPTAYYAANDLMAIGILRALRERQIDVPGAVSVVGTNDSPEASHLRPALTSLRVPYKRIAAIAAHMLINAIKEDSLPTGHQILSSQLIERETTAQCLA